MSESQLGIEKRNKCHEMKGKLRKITFSQPIALLEEFLAILAGFATQKRDSSGVMRCDGEVGGLREKRILSAASCAGVKNWCMIQGFADWGGCNEGCGG
ncbi:hypothetical protein [Paracidovorax anthurii]|uniref:hypothetical protein n=1 Tax=Paracidovorax anthurii TaxID=78229 RepID=UPI0011BE4999|nr:hypothetical protein [Paracidovorax anthurii]